MEAGTVVGELADAVQNGVDYLLSRGVVTTCIVVLKGDFNIVRRSTYAHDYVSMGLRIKTHRGIFLAVDDLFRVIQLAVGARTDFITHRWLEINIDSTGYLPKRNARDSRDD